MIFAYETAKSLTIKEIFLRSPAQSALVNLHTKPKTFR